RQLPPQRGRGQIFRLFDFLEGLPAQTGGASSLQGAMWEYVHQTKRRGLMLILSDLLYPDGYEEGLKLARYHHFDPFVIHILSDDELMPAVRGDARLVDAETQQAVEVSVDGPALEAYARARDGFLGGLERSWWLVLQVRTAAVVVLALARPQVVLPAAGGLATVLVMDTSASMQATDVAPSRFEAARAAAVAEVARGAGPVMVVDAGPQPHAVTGFVDHGTARAALLRLHPTDAPARLEQAVTMAVAQRAGGRGVRVVVFTDRGTAVVPGVQYSIVGQTDRNVGLAGVRADRAAEGTVAIVRVYNAGTQAERVP